MTKMVERHTALMVVHGACPTGADFYAQRWVDAPMQDWNLRRSDTIRLAIAERNQPDWRLGLQGGPQRNQRMVDKGADACFAWPDSGRKRSGTLDCVARAWVKGIPVWIFSDRTPLLFERLSEERGECLARRILKWGK